MLSVSGSEAGNKEAGFLSCWTVQSAAGASHSYLRLEASHDFPLDPFDLYVLDGFPLQSSCPFPCPVFSSLLLRPSVISVGPDIIHPLTPAVRNIPVFHR